MTIVAIYFAPTTFPVMVYLSGSLHLCNIDDRLTIARWGIALTHFARGTIGLIKSIHNNNDNISPNILIDVRFRLSRNLFFKPVRNIETENGSSIDTALSDCSNARINMNMILHVYSLLYSVPTINRYVLLPVGVVSCSSPDNEYGTEIRNLLVNAMKTYFPMWYDTNSYTHVPFIAFPLLRDSDGWKSLDTIPPVEFVECFLEELSLVVAALNTAKVAHMDLR